MINLPPNHMNLVQVKEFSHDPSMAILYLRLRNENNQYVAWYQSIRTEHGLDPSTKLDEALDQLAETINPDIDPYINGESRLREPAKDQQWEQVELPGGMLVSDYRMRHGLPEPVND